ncbi:hypothetical protein [Algoriphagus sediminis]|uniref:Uncharacterized protein n=1 Tax=Algoriphagus sediminis TaxID=3057113 RepID=A0ABT7YG40_9BACT|nr:hypothetical protein [Algoriphagus sediminis]MDN3205436.1 hypothetical protein [Algoriphagus sediminis]
MIKIVFFSVSLMLLGWSVRAQEPEVSDSFLALYQNQLPYFQELITGGEYAFASNTYGGEPYYKSQHFDFGLLSINGIDYEEVPLLYDSFNDHLITFHPIHKQKILFKPEKVEAFRIFENEEFQYFEGNSDYNKDKNGFYRVVAGDDLKVLTKYFKELKPSKEIEKNLFEFREYEDYFLWYKDDFVKVEKLKTAIKALGINKKEVRKELDLNSYKFNQDIPGSLAKLVAFHSKNSTSFNGFVE